MHGRDDHRAAERQHRSQQPGARAVGIFAAPKHPNASTGTNTMFEERISAIGCSPITNPDSPPTRCTSGGYAVEVRERLRELPVGQLAVDQGGEVLVGAAVPVRDPVVLREPPHRRRDERDTASQTPPAGG